MENLRFMFSRLIQPTAANPTSDRVNYRNFLAPVDDAFDYNWGPSGGPEAPVLPDMP
jgi:hypothetical protein